MCLRVASYEMLLSVGGRLFCSHNLTWIEIFWLSTFQPSCMTFAPLRCLRPCYASSYDRFSYLTPPRVKAKSHLMPGGLGSSSDLSFGLFIAYVVLSVFSVLRHPILCIMRKRCIRAFWGMIDAAIITFTAHVLLVIMLGGIRISQLETDKMVGSVNYSKFDVQTYLPPHNGVPPNTVHHMEEMYEEIESIFDTEELYRIFAVIGALMLCFRVASSMAPSVRLSIVTRTLAESVYGVSHSVMRPGVCERRLLEVYLGTCAALVVVLQQAHHLPVSCSPVSFWL